MESVTREEITDCVRLPARCDVERQKMTMDKIVIFCDVGPEQVIGAHSVPSTYHIPLLLK